MELLNVTSRAKSTSTLAKDPTSLARYERKPKGHNVRLIDQNRLEGFISTGQWADINLQSMLYHARFDSSPNIQVSVYSVPDLVRPPFAEAIKGEFRPAKVGESFGPSWSTHWFKVQILVPEEYASAERVELHFDLGGEGMVWTTDGVPLHGLTGGRWRDRRIEFIIPKEWKAGKEHTFYIEGSMNGMFGCHPEPEVMPRDGLDIGSFTKPPDPHRTFKFSVAELRVPNMDAMRLYWDYLVIQDVAVNFPDNSWEAQQAFQVAIDIINTFRRGSNESILQGRKIAQRLLGNHADDNKGWKDDEDARIWAIGHCHIDTAWLWPFAETKRKVARSWATQCDLMDRYPEHHFAASTAQQYLWLKEDYPGLFERVKQKVKEGRFIPVGGTWVEYDSHYASGESLVRQFLQGQRFFESNFGERCKTFWLPDTFGYSSQLPQLARSAGMKYFWTQKISWNSVNRFPHTTFKWVGLDGSQMLVHMPPSDTYGAQITVNELRDSVERHLSLREDNSSMLIFGNGDGGGGPLPLMVEKLRRVQGISQTIGGQIPSIKITTPEAFFERLEKKVQNGTNLATHHGEIYLESCRGCYTTQAKTKLNNRRAEILMRELEFLATLASIDDPSWKYPKRTLDDLWQTILLCHFHDVLPGSAIEMVFDDAAKLYADLFQKGHALRDEIALKVGIGGTGNFAALNILNWPRSEIIHVTADEALASQVNSQKSATGGAFVPIRAQANAVTNLDAASAYTTKVELSRTDSGSYVLQNGKVKVTIVGGEIASFIDLDLGRELIPEGEKGNKLVLFYDQAMTFWDAWDVEIYHLELPEYLGAGEVKVLEEGPLRATLDVTHQISSESWIKSTISLDAYIPQSETPFSHQNPIQSLLRVDCEVEWHECRRFLKVEFPWDIHADHATYETQFGVVRSPTHYNTSWDYAKFEVVAHRFADLSEFGYGVAILNNCKYGFETQGNVQRLSLLRSPKGPDEHADMGRQKFSYGVAPHTGGFIESEVSKAGINFNNDLRIVSVSNPTKLNEKLSTFKIVGPPNVFLETIKRGEDDEDLEGHYKISKRPGRSIILRTYEGLGGSAKAEIKTILPVKKAFKTNILEDDLEELEFKDGVIPVSYKAFEIVTLRLQL